MQLAIPPHVRYDLLVILVNFMTTKWILASEFGDENDQMDGKESSDLALWRLSDRITSHDFCAEENADFWVGKEEAELQPIDSFFSPCSTLDDQWTRCENVAHITNLTKLGYLCPYFGSSKGPQLYANVTCKVLPCIECYGTRNFTKLIPCTKYTGHYFLSALLYSIFLGLFAVDRFYLGYSAIAVGKLMTLGGLGVWWIVDIFLLLNGQLRPADDSEWQPFWR